MFLHAEALAKEFCENACDMAVDMMLDIPEEYVNFRQVEKMIETAIESYSEAMLGDYLKDIESTIREQIKARKVKLVDCTFDSNGVKKVDYKFNTVS